MRVSYLSTGNTEIAWNTAYRGVAINQIRSVGAPN
jgi:hypothetical protein